MGSGGGTNPVGGSGGKPVGGCGNPTDGGWGGGGTNPCGGSVGKPVGGCGNPTAGGWGGGGTSPNPSVNPVGGCDGNGGGGRSDPGVVKFPGILMFPGKAGGAGLNAPIKGLMGGGLGARAWGLLHGGSGAPKPARGGGAPNGGALLFGKGGPPKFMCWLMLSAYTDWTQGPCAICAFIAHIAIQGTKFFASRKIFLFYSL